MHFTKPLFSEQIKYSKYYGLILPEMRLISP